MSLKSISEERIRMIPISSKSTESIYSSSSSKFSTAGLYKRKLNSMRQASILPVTNKNSDIRQRVLSARRLKVKSLENQIVAAQQTISELANENRVLKSIYKRQDSALSKYEGTSAELPQLLNSHAEEIRVWQTKYKKLQAYNKELVIKLKQKESTLLNLTDENKHLKQLSNDKHLEERERLTVRVRHLEETLMEKEKKIRILARKLQLEEKSYKAQLNNEHNRLKEVQAKFENLKTNKSNEDQQRTRNHELNDKSSKVSFLPARVKSYKEIIRDQNCSMHHKANSLKIPHRCIGNQATSPRTHKTDENTGGNSIENCPSQTHSQKVNSKISNSSDCHPNVNRSIKNFKNSDGHETSDEETTKNQYVKSKTILKDISKDSLESSSGKLSNGKKYDKDSFEDDIDSHLGNYDYNDNNDDDGIDDDDVYICNGKNSKQNPNTSDNSSNSDEDKTNNEKNKIHKDFTDICRKMSEDYKQRESYLDKFCRQTIGTPNSNSNANTSSDCKDLDKKKHTKIDPNKKSKLLAALKDIDEDSNGSSSK